MGSGMIQPSLLSAKASKVTLTETLAAYFLARPNAWIDGMEIASVAGSYAWRSRCSDVRRTFGMVIENRQRRMRGTPERDYRQYVISEYRYVPAAEAQKEIA